MQTILLPLSVLYAGIVRLRNRYYDRNPGAVSRAEIPVVSIGNITVGGTGKTPVVIELCRKLTEWGRRPAILTRGYRAARGQTADEVQEFADAVPGVPVVVNADRVAGAATARTTHHADVLVLDDGFQHRRLGRDLDIVLIDALSPWGGGAVLPAGRLREPLSALRRADVIVVTRTNQAADSVVDEIAARVQGTAPNTLVLRAEVVAAGCVRSDESTVDPATKGRERVLGVCGIGNPQTFRALMREEFGADCRVRNFADHHRYTPRDARAIQAAAREIGANWVVTTRKDWVKLHPIWPSDGVELLRLEIRIELRGEVKAFEQRLRRALEQVH